MSLDDGLAGSFTRPFATLFPRAAERVETVAVARDMATAGAEIPELASTRQKNHRNP